MTSDKSGPVRTASSALDDDLEITRDRKALTGEQPAVESSETSPAGVSSGRSAASSAPVKSDAADSGSAPVTSSGQHEAPPSGPVAAAASSDKPSAPAPSAKPIPQPAKPAAPAPSVPAPSAKAATPPAPSDPDTAIPTTGGVWRSAYEAGRSDKDSNPSSAAAVAAATDSEGKGPQSQAPGTGRPPTKADIPAPRSAPVPEPDNTKSWNRVSQPAVPPVPPAPPAPPTAAAEGMDGVRAGAMKAAQAALDVARSAAKKVSSIMPDDEARTAANPNPDLTATKPRPEMHYTAGGVRGTATPIGVPAGTVPEETQPAPSPAPEAPRAAPAGPRRVRLAVSRVDPWSVMKLAFLLAVAIAIMTVVATAVFWSVLDGFGVFTTVQSFVEDAVGPQSNVNLTQFVEFPRVISLATLISICNIVLLTAIATIMAFLYNITAALVGGVHMTLTDD
ncbi:DUF3566 domain-containing protein [Promicromonospora sp. Populi]|uniref:DUF3566 domain-containing protein n=1 Tax=Promicromonospora sp. Populi TaxID=3239420 RepID=UPI0034E23B0E